MLNKNALLLLRKKSAKGEKFVMDVSMFASEQGEARGFDKSMGEGSITPTTFLGAEINQFLLRVYDGGFAPFEGPEFSKLRLSEELQPAPSQIQLTLKGGVMAEETVLLNAYTGSLFVGDPVLPYPGGEHEIELVAIY